MEKATAPALVLEGGGFRGMFTSGVLDVFQEQGIYGFSSVWGVSAGALNGASFCSRQAGRVMRDMLAFRDDWRFMSVRSLVTTGDIAGADFLYGEIEDEIDPFDNETFNASDLPLYAVASDVTFGTPAYLSVNRMPDDICALRASASLPAVSTIVEYKGHSYLDGGMTDSMPFAAAMALPDAPEVAGFVPAERVVVVLTQDRDYVRCFGGTEKLALRSGRYKNYPYFCEALGVRFERYNAQREELWDLERQGLALVLAPEEPPGVKTNESRGEPLLRLYLAGRNQAKRRLEEIREFVSG